MPDKGQKLKPDVVLKNYWSNNEQFADLFNAVLFQGRQLILPEELEDVDTEESSVLQHRDYAESIRSSRDIIKIQKKACTYGVDLVMYGLEDQEHIHYGMPVRVMGYDYGLYKKQYDTNAQKYKESKESKGAGARWVSFQNEKDRQIYSCDYAGCLLWGEAMGWTGFPAWDAEYSPLKLQNM